MPGLNKPRKFRRLPPHKKLPAVEPRLTASARKLYNRIYTFGVAGCWMSNNTLADQLDYCTKTIKRARKLLEERGDIFTARTLPRTWSCWAKTHPVVKKKAILYFKGGYIDNPYYEDPETKTVGGQNVPSEGTKCPLRRKNGVVLTDSIPKGDSDKGSPPLADTIDSPESTGSEPLFSGGASPPHTPLAVREGESGDSTPRERWDQIMKDRKLHSKKHQAKK